MGAAEIEELGPVDHVVVEPKVTLWLGIAAVLAAEAVTVAGALPRRAGHAVGAWWAGVERREQADERHAAIAALAVLILRGHGRSARVPAAPQG